MRDESPLGSKRRRLDSQNTEEKGKATVIEFEFE